jgi:phosphatidylserine/phosphatidylglycerophosphate/cardiolipin synthase-like enzyme
MFSFNMLDTLDRNLQVRTLVKLLCKKKQEGIDIKIIFGNSYKHDESNFFQLLDSSNEMAFTFLKSFGVQVGFFNHYKYQSSHSKYVIIDNQEVIIGSHNFSPRSFSIGLDDSVKIVDNDFANELTSIFLADWKFVYIPNNIETVDFDNSKIYFPEIISKKVDATTIKDNFACKVLANQYYFDYLIDEIKKAKKSISISMFYFSYFKDKNSETSRIISSIENAVKNNIEVKVILDRDRPTDIYSSYKANKKRFEQLKRIGVSVKLDKKEVASHAKLVIIDNEKVIIGSHNWTFGSFAKYEETSVAIDSKDLAIEYNTIFNTRFSNLS